MNVVIDTNIVLSAILSAKGKINDLILNSEREFSFFKPTFLLGELENHHQKLLKISGFYRNRHQVFAKNTLSTH